ncbi:hypothetical protein M3G03_10090 [Aestuariimicrobium sp. p3-SID1156]|uniref:hypothetical protein n=1 Tax=Aestuariimicrobium sp. p3-SID1156 TaxID=2916038 RepID=UPI00223C0599|nr:hypothetical protein [Aestuariimicrobium sp. p3-SID1156]MCT1459880.1 hypothetical protein [Aestuariimicrobium sp. p3-SID1156]
MAMRPCAEPGCPVLLRKAGRCQKHRRYSPTYLERDWAEQKRRAAVVAKHRATHGDWCPGWPSTGHAPHACTDLTAAHVVAVANGGGAGPLLVLCRSENSRLRDSDE